MRQVQCMYTTPAIHAGSVCTCCVVGEGHVSCGGGQLAVLTTMQAHSFTSPTRRPSLRLRPQDRRVPSSGIPPKVQPIVADMLDAWATDPSVTSLYYIPAIPWLDGLCACSPSTGVYATAGVPLTAWPWRHLSSMSGRPGASAPSSHRWPSQIKSARGRRKRKMG
ncbi:hypothetical protein BD413DRAFT_19730 [Trametes elegans]|nr:hypothetical protein BD413DRAFT_19730 [Trametes elegans]